MAFRNSWINTAIKNQDLYLIINNKKNSFIVFITISFRLFSDFVNSELVMDWILSNQSFEISNDNIDYFIYFNPFQFYQKKNQFFPAITLDISSLSQIQTLFAMESIY